MTIKLHRFAIHLGRYPHAWLECIASCDYHCVELSVTVLTVNVAFKWIRPKAKKCLKGQRGFTWLREL